MRAPPARRGRHSFRGGGRHSVHVTGCSLRPVTELASRLVLLAVGCAWAQQCE